MALVADKELVGAFGADGTHEPLGVTVRSWRARRRLDDCDVFTAEHFVERSRELGSRSCMRKRNELIRSANSMARLRATWVAHSPLGCAVTPRRCALRVWISIMNST